MFLPLSIAMRNFKWNASTQWLCLLGTLLLAGVPGRAQEADGRADPAGQAVSRNEGSKAELYYYIEYKPANWQTQATIKVKSYNGNSYDEVDLGSGTAGSVDEWLKTPVSKIENEIAINHAYPLPVVVPDNVASYRYRLIAPPGCNVYNRVLDAVGCFQPGSVVETTASSATQYEVVVVPSSRGGALSGKASKVSTGDGSMGVALGFLANGQTAGFVELMPRLVSKKDFSSGDLVATYGRPLSAADLSCVSLTPEVEVINITIPEYNGQLATRGLRQVIAPQAVVDVQQDGFDLWIKFYLPSQKQTRRTSEPDAAGTGTIGYAPGTGPYTFSGIPFVTYRVQWLSTGWAKTSSSGQYKSYKCPATFTVTRTEAADVKTVTLSKTESITISSGEAEPVYETCMTCGGSGTVTGDVECEPCGGDGVVACNVCGGNGACTRCGGDGGCVECNANGYVDCSVCGGGGEVSCESCGGSGEGDECGTCEGTGEAEVDGEQGTCPDCGGEGSSICSTCEGEGTQQCGGCEDGNGKVDCGDCGGEGGCSLCDGTGACFACNGEGAEGCISCLGEGSYPDQVPCDECGGEGQILIDVIYPPTYVNNTDEVVQNGFGAHLTQSVSTVTRYEQDGSLSSSYDYANQFNTTVRITSDASFYGSVYEGKFPAFRREVVDNRDGKFGVYDLSNGTQKVKTTRVGTVEPQTLFGFYRLNKTDALYATHHGRLKWQMNPTGGWVMVDYSADVDGLGQTIRVISPYKDAAMPSWSPSMQSWLLTETGSQVIGDDCDLTMPAHIVPGTSLSGYRVTSSTYTADWEGVKCLPDTVTVTVDGKQVGCSDYDYAAETANSQPLWVTTSKTYTSSGNYLTSISKVYEGRLADGTPVASWLRGLPYSSQGPDGSKETVAYHRGTYNTDKTFTPSATGLGFRSVVFKGRASSTSGGTALSSYDGATIDTVYMIPNVSTAEVTLRDDRAFTMRSETLLYTGSGWTVIDSADMQYDNAGNLIRREKLNGVLYEATYVNGQKTTEKDEQGLTTHFYYDTEGRVDYTIRAAFGDVPALRTSFEYDAENRILSTKIGNKDSEQIISSKTYDKSGLVKTETSENLTTSYDYVLENGLLTKTIITLPGGATRILENYRDGRLKSVSGTAGIAEYYHYEVNSDGQEVVTKYLGFDNSARWLKTYADWAGRTVKTESSSVDTTGAAATLVATSTYNSLGQLMSTETASLAPTLYGYDGNGVMCRSGLDLDQNGTLSASDRMTSTTYDFRKDGGVWERYGGDISTVWNYVETRAYSNGSSDGQIQTRTWTRMTNFDRVSGPANATGTAIAESIAADANGNRAVTQTFLDRTNATVTTVVWSPFVVQPSVSVSIAGRLDHEISSAGVSIAYSYDELGRATSSTDRTGINRMTYWAGTTRTRTVVDSRGVTQHSFTYDSAGCLKQDQVPRILDGCVSGTNSSYYAYNARGQLTHVWGDVPYPVKYEYDGYGDRTDQYTYRDTGTNWSSADLAATAWPNNGDKTHFEYFDANGLLRKKTDADNKSVSYTYNIRGQLKTREWARKLPESSTPVTTTYNYYDTIAGEISSTTYNDGTPTVTYVYDKLGRLQTVQDATGDRTFTYSLTDLRPEAELFGRLNSSVTSHVFGNARQLTNQYDPTTGRFTGFSLDNNGASEHALSYGFDPVNGRLQTITSGAGTFRYGYLANSNLISGVTRGNYAQSRTYEPNRNVLTNLATSTQTGTIAAYTYASDDLGRRTSVEQSGQVYNPYTLGTQIMRTAYGYDQRNEVTSAVTTAGGTVLPGRSFGYAFDPIGNRTQDSLDGTANSYESNNLNQYKNRATPGYLSVSGTANRTGGASLTINSADVSTWVNNYFHHPVNKTGATSAYGQTFNFNATASGASQAETVWTAVRPVNESFTYDDDGNLLSDSLWVYRYDGENRLIEMTAKVAQTPSQPQALRFRYDYMGRRVAKEVYTYTGTADVPTSYTFQSTTYFVWQGWTLIGEYNAGLTLTRRFTFGIDLSGSLGGAGDIGGLLAIEDLGTSGTYPLSLTTYLASFDGNGNLMGLADGSTGALAAAYEYDPSGNILRSTGSYAKQNPFRFAGKYYDTETGLSYYGFRYYCASTGRFVNRDPIGEQGGLNIYCYAHNDPVNGMDLYGLAWWNPLSWNWGGFFKSAGNFIRSTIIRPVTGAIYTTYAHVREALYSPVRAVNRIYNTIKGGGMAALNVLNPFDHRFIGYELLDGVVDSARVIGGIPISFLSGDFLDIQGAKRMTFDKSRLLITFNGIANNRTSAEHVKAQTASTMGANDSTHVTNRTFMMVLGDLVQIIGNEFGLVDITAIRGAEALRKAAKEQGNINVVAHSQGTMTFRRALDLVDDDSIRSRVHYQGFGPQKFVSEKYLRLGSARNVWNVQPAANGQSGRRDFVPTTNYYPSLSKLCGLLFLLPGYGNWEKINSTINSTPIGKKGNMHSFKYYENMITP